MNNTNPRRWFMPASIAAASLAVIVIVLVRMLPAAPPPPPPPPGGPPLDVAVARLNLTPDQKQKTDIAMETLHRKQRELTDDFLRQMKDILSPEQMRQLQESINQPPPPPGEDAPTTQPDRAVNDADAPRGTVIFHGGYDTDPRDHGRPVVLIAAALNVPSTVFRAAFSGVTPAAEGQEPQPDQVRRNKSALLKVLAPYGVDNDRLDTVSNYYRYNRGKHEMWRNKPATATAIITNGVVTGIKLTDPGSGYSSPPTLSVAGYGDVHALVTLGFGTDFKTNGSIKSITIEPLNKP
jgi:Spy/CpxP family protein refolding chaperone